MKAIRVHEFGGPEVLRIEEVPDLKPSTGQLVIRVSADWREPRRHLHAHGDVHAQASASVHSGHGCWRYS